MSPYDGMKLVAALRLLLRTGRGRQRGRAATLRAAGLRAELDTRKQWSLWRRMRGR